MAYKMQKNQFYRTYIASKKILFTDFGRLSYTSMRQSLIIPVGHCRVPFHTEQVKRFITSVFHTKASGPPLFPLSSWVVTASCTSALFFVACCLHLRMAIVLPFPRTLAGDFRSPSKNLQFGWRRIISRFFAAENGLQFLFCNHTYLIALHHEAWEEA